ncbi:MAG TPA: VIT and VWA domain-containing protein [Candidatus Sulfotelmatobacter sp.]|nr:VIT and VWA domain-containing protein [Candidatus Sulfotelmatobacter sp.]
MNTSRILPVTPKHFGLFAIIESKRVVLPLKGVECEFFVQGGVVEVSMSQVFRQENPNPLDCQYQFPLPADASVYFCEADINGRLITAQVKERDEARKIADEKKAEGFRTALVESERDNFFSLELGNVQPDDLIIVRLKYFQTLRAIAETKSIEIPFCPGIRYIPGKPLLRSNSGKGVVDDTNEVPDASRISPVRIDAGHPDAAYVDVRGHMDAEFLNMASLVSPSHIIDVCSREGQAQVTLSSKGEVPDRDFVLRWEDRNAESVAPRAWLRQKGNENYALMEVRAPRQNSATETALDFYFLVDRSGSMSGLKWEKAVEALQSCVGVLGPNDRVMVTIFESNFCDFAERPLPVKKMLADQQFQNLKELRAGGGTEMAPALKHVLDVAARNSAGRDKNLILITDAQIGNESTILDLMRAAPDMPVHCFGIDIALNDALLLALARQQGGAFHSLNPNDDIASLVTKLGNTLRQPELLDLHLSEGWEVADARIANLYSGQVVYLSARAAGALPLELTARTPSGEAVSFKFKTQTLPHDAPFLHWHKTRIQRLLAENQNAEAIQLSVAGNLLCRLTSFVAWDESEKVAVSQHDLVQPALLYAPPAGAGGLFAERTRSRGVPDDIRFCMEKLSTDAKESICDFELGSRPLRKDASVRTQWGQFVAVCLRLSGDDWNTPFQAIFLWHENASPAEIKGIEITLLKLTRQLKLCADLIQILDTSGGGLIHQLRQWRLQFRIMLQRQRSNGEWQDFESICRAVGSVDSSTPPERLAELKSEVQKKAVELLKQFAGSLPLARAST